MENAYNTNDPKKLLELKRMEADAMLDVLRSINNDALSIKQLCMIVRNVLRAQIGVRKMIFLYEYEDAWKEGVRVGFDHLSEEAVEELIDIEEITAITEADYPELHKLSVEYIIPFINRTNARAFFAIAEFADSDVEAQGDLIFIESMGNILSVAIRNKELFKEKMAQEFIRKELEVAETIQKQLLISDFTRFQEIDVFGLNIPHHGIGGDFYDVIKKQKGSTFVCIADVSGKGIGAALLMSNLQANLRALCAQYDDVVDIVRELNKTLFNVTTGEKFVTLFIAKIDSKKKSLTYVNAGHNYPMFLSKNHIERLDKGCTILGIMPELHPESYSFSFDFDDILFMFTDGVTEQFNPKEEMFGSERTMKILKQYPECNASDIIKRILEELEVFTDTQVTTDDLTMLCVKFL